MILSHTQRTRVKMCGITRLEDAHAAIAAGADALGFVFYPASKRFITAGDAATIARQLPPFVQTVALFCNASLPEIQTILDLFTPDLLQFHGDENADFCELFNRPYLKAVAMEHANELTWQQYERDFPKAHGLLADAHGGDKTGGSGEVFDWCQLPPRSERHKPLILAGGISLDNVAQAIEKLIPFAIDVSSSIEISPGCKSYEKMAALMHAIRIADSQFIVQ